MARRKSVHPLPVASPEPAQAWRGAHGVAIVHALGPDISASLPAVTNRMGSQGGCCSGKARLTTLVNYKAAQVARYSLAATDVPALVAIACDPSLHASWAPVHALHFLQALPV